MDLSSLSPQMLPSDLASSMPPFFFIIRASGIGGFSLKKGYPFKICHPNQLGQLGLGGISDPFHRFYVFNLGHIMTAKKISRWAAFTLLGATREEIILFGCRRSDHRLDFWRHGSSDGAEGQAWSVYFIPSRLSSLEVTLSLGWLCILPAWRKVPHSFLPLGDSLFDLIGLSRPFVSSRFQQLILRFFLNWPFMRERYWSSFIYM